MGTVGPGSIHLLNGRSDALFADVATFRHTVTSAEQMPRVCNRRSTAPTRDPASPVLSLPGDVGSVEQPKHAPAPRFVTTRATTVADPRTLGEAARLIDDAERVTMLVGIGARGARAEMLALAEQLKARWC